MSTHLIARDDRPMGPASARYMIRVNGHLGATLLSAFPAMAWEWAGSETILTGELDQPGLYGALGVIEALGLDLIAVCRLEAQPKSAEPGESCSP